MKNRLGFLLLVLFILGFIILIPIISASDGVLSRDIGEHLYINHFVANDSPYIGLTEYEVNNVTIVLYSDVILNVINLNQSLVGLYFNELLSIIDLNVSGNYSVNVSSINQIDIYAVYNEYSRVLFWHQKQFIFLIEEDLITPNDYSDFISGYIDGIRAIECFLGDLDCDGNITTGELVSYFGLWIDGRGVSLENIIEAIDLFMLPS